MRAKTTRAALLVAIAWRKSQRCTIPVLMALKPGERQMSMIIPNVEDVEDSPNENRRIANPKEARIKTNGNPCNSQALAAHFRLSTEYNPQTMAAINAAHKILQNITFSKNLNMPLETLVSSKKKHQSLMRFRAGVEGCISWLKRSFNMSRILDRSLKTFHSVAQCAAVAYNLILLARILLRQEPN